MKYLPSEDVERDWPVCLPYIQDAIDHSPFGMQPEYVREMLELPQYQLWRGDKFAVVTELQGHLFNFWLAGGDMNELALGYTDAENWAKLHGATRIMVYGRRGWEKSFLKHYGYQPKWIVLEKTLWEQQHYQS